ncbi:MAG: hypothetical protein ACK5N8_08545 [Alphaproteobacteria bacterium]
MCYDKDENRKYVREDEVTAQVQKILNSIKIPSSVLGEINSYLKSLKAEEVKFNKDAVRKARIDLDKTIDRINALINLYIDGKIEEDIYNFKMKSLKEEKLSHEKNILEHSNSDNKFNEVLI